jgi:DNA-binding GntR family transcriptional regulator
MSIDRRGDNGRRFVPVTRAHAVADEVRRLIEEQEFPPGQHLRQAEIAKRFGVSTTPVREAFTMLAREGVVHQDAHRGVVVFDPSLEELTENYEIREALEPLATELATKKITPDELDELDRLTVEMKAADPSGVPAMNHLFHTTIYGAAERRRLAEIIENLRKSSASYLNFTVRHYDPIYAGKVQVEHEEIVAALRARTGKSAAKLMREHLRHNRRQVAKLIKQ